MAAPKKLSPAAVAVLDRATVRANVIHIPQEPRLERKLYEEVDAALKAHGGKWKGGKTMGHVFDHDPSNELAVMLSTGGYVDTKKLYSFFATPAAVAARLVEFADVQKGMRVLEPSAGTGAIARAVLDAASVDLVCIELDEKRAAQAGSAHPQAEVIVGDFLDYVSPPNYDRVVANVPFTTPGRPQADIDHVTRAFELLAPGGRLVSIMSGGVLFRQNAKTRAFRELLDEHGEIVEELPPGTFPDAGVHTVIVRLDKAA